MHIYLCQLIMFNFCHADYRHVLHSSPMSVGKVSGPVLYFRGDWSWNNFYSHSTPFGWIIQEGLLLVTSKSMCTKYLLTACSAYQEKCVVRWTDRHALTIAVDFGRKATKQTNTLISIIPVISMYFQSKGKTEWNLIRYLSSEASWSGSTQFSKTDKSVFNRTEVRKGKR